MSQASPDMRRFAEQLLGFEMAGEKGTDLPVILNVCAKLQHPLITLMGEVGFRAFISRALALAGSEVPWLRAVHVKSDASLEGLTELKGQVSSDEFTSGSVVLVAQLLGLLTSFMGEMLVVRILRGVWPHLKPGELNFGKEN